MDCDAKKKALLVDESGTFLGSAGASVIPEAEWNWDATDARIRHGVGMYRVPNTMKSRVDGSMVADDEIINSNNKGTCICRAAI